MISQTLKIFSSLKIFQQLKLILKATDLRKILLKYKQHWPGTKNESLDKINALVTYSTLVELNKDFTDKKKLEEIILVEIPNKFTLN